MYPKALAPLVLSRFLLFATPSASWVPSSSTAPLLQSFSRYHSTRSVVIPAKSASSSSRLFMSTEQRKAGVASPEELQSFVEMAGEKLLVVDVRNPDAAAEPGDQKSLAVASLPSSERPRAVHLLWDRNTNSMPLPPTDDLDTPIITHCGGGGRGQLAKDFLISHGYKNVINGGGPKETDCWAVFGNK